MKRIGISGHGGTGKTTLTRFLSARLALPYVGEGVQEWASAHPDVPLWGLPAEEQLHLQRYALAYKIEREHGLSAFVSDRTTVDAVSLLTLRMQRLGQDVPACFSEEALSHARNAYDLAIVFEPNRISPTPDEIAMLDATLRRREYEMTLQLYESLAIPILRVPPLPPEEIAPFVLGSLGRMRIQHCREILASAAAGQFDSHTAALYLWGSVLSDDFLPAMSDVDAVLVTQRTPAPGAVNGLTQAARGQDALFERLDLSIVALEEWIRGERNGPLAHIEPEILFSEVRAAMLVWGRGELLPQPSPTSLTRQLRLRLDALERRRRLHADDAAQEPLKYVLKELGFICHLHHQLETGAHPFSYETLLSHADDITRESVEALLAARTNGWNGDRDRVTRIADILTTRMSMHLQ